MLALIVLQTNVHATVNDTWIDKEIQAYIQNKPVKAIIYGLWINGEPVSINALGNSMTAVPATEDMHFRIGGVTETMLTTVLMRRVELNKLSLDSTVSLWFPDLPNANQVTLKMLANGTSGYPDYVYNKKFIDIAINQPFKQWSDKELLDYAFQEEPLFQPGTDQHYSHTDYVILGSILSRESNKPLKELFHSFILNQLGMKKTEFNRTASIPSPVLHSFSHDRSVYEDATFWNPSWTSSSGAMISTISDLGRWANAWMQGSLLTTESSQKLRAPDTVGKGKNKPDLYFAMGFGVVNHWLMQNPSFGGYSGVFAVLPEKNIVLIAFNTVGENYEGNTNLSVALWKLLAADLAPEYPLPEF